MLSNELYVIEVKGVWQVRLRGTHQVFSTSFTKEGIKEVLKTLINRYKDYSTLKVAIGNMEYNRPLKAEEKAKREKAYLALDHTEFREYMESLEKVVYNKEGINIQPQPKGKLKKAPTASEVPSKVKIKPKKKLLINKVEKKEVKPKVEAKVKVKPLGLKRRLIK